MSFSLVLASSLYREMKVVLNLGIEVELMPLISKVTFPSSFFSFSPPPPPPFLGGRVSDRCTLLILIF